jgi:fatty-acyl-CoA synthase
MNNQVYRTELNPVAFLRRSACVYPDRVAISHGARRISYRQMEERVDRFAAQLRAEGLTRGDRVAVLLPNIPAMAEAHFAVPAAGGVLVTLNTRLSAFELRHPDPLRRDGAAGRR